MPNFRYQALTQNGELVSGTISAPTAAEVAHRIDYLHLVPIDTVVQEVTERTVETKRMFAPRARAEDVTTFTLDLALLLRAGARLDDALELLASDIDIGRLRTPVANIRNQVLSGETLADALERHSDLFPPMYVALVRVGEASGALGRVLELLAAERARAETARHKLADALRYPALVLFGAACVLSFFLLFVLPQFGAVLRDFSANIDPVAQFFLRASDFVTLHKEAIGLTCAILLAAALLALRQRRVRTKAMSVLGRLPILRTMLRFHRTALFCRNLGVLLGAGVSLTTALRILSNMMATVSDATSWDGVLEQVRQGRKLSDALDGKEAMPAMAVRMLRLGEETGQLPVLSERIAQFYEVKLQRSLDRMAALAGPLAIITISIIIGGLIVSVMTSLLSISQLVG